MKYLSTIIKAFFTVAIIIILIKFVGWEKIVTSIKSVNKISLMKAIFLAPVVMVLGSLKWFFLLRGHGLDITYRQAFKSFFFGMGIGIFTPGKAGEFTRILLIPQGSKLKLAALVFYDRLLDLSVVCLFAVFSVFFFLGPRSGLLYTVGVVVLLFLIFERRMLFGSFRAIIHKIPPLKNLVKEPSAIINLGADTVSACLLTRIILSLVDLFQFFFLIQAFHSISVLEVLLSYPPMLLISVLPFTIAGLGLREGFSIYILRYFGIPPAASVNSAFLLFCINTFFPGILGVLFAYNLKIPLFNNRKK